MGREILELTANIIEELMYVQCIDNGNEYLSLDTLLDHRRNGSALSVEDQNIVVKEKETLRKSTAGWDIYCDWKDVIQSKELHPIQIPNFQSEVTQCLIFKRTYIFG